MKTVKITMTIRVTNDFYDENFESIKNDILSGKYQKEMKEEGILDVKATFEVLK